MIVQLTSNPISIRLRCEAMTNKYKNNVARLHVVRSYKPAKKYDSSKANAELKSRQCARKNGIVST